MNSCDKISAHSGSPLPLQQGERIEVRGSKIASELKLQTLTLPSPLGKGEADQSVIQVTRVKPIHEMTTQVTPTLDEFMDSRNRATSFLFSPSSSRMEKRQFQLSRNWTAAVTVSFLSPPKRTMSRAVFRSWVWTLAWFCKATGARFESSRTETTGDSKQAAIHSMRCEN